MAPYRQVAALYDIHGNLPALEAVLGVAQDEGTELVLVGGDVFPGPMCTESLSLLTALEIPVLYIMGNGDREILGARNGDISPLVPAALQHAMRWCASEVTDDVARTMAGWPSRLRELAVSCSATRRHRAT
jgi:Calcineurin-like phosphoesterase